MSNENNLIAIIPAAGKAKRLSPLPFSKELYPVGADNSNQEKAVPRVISSFLLENLVYAGISNIHFVIRPEKNDIIKYYKGGRDYNCNITYHIADYEYGVPFSINQVYPFIKNNSVAFGFPDIYIKPLNIFDRLKKKFIQNKKADVLLGLVQIHNYRIWDMVDIEEDNKIKTFVFNSENGKNLKYGWAVAMWRPSFSEYLNDFVNQQIQSSLVEDLDRNEYSIGFVFQKAIDDGLSVFGESFIDAVCIDAGTYPGILKVINEIKTNQNL